MTQPLVVQGTGAELAAYLERFRDRPNLTLIIPEENAGGPDGDAPRPCVLQFGSFPELRALTEADFASAEWRGDEEGIA